MSYNLAMMKVKLHLIAIVTNIVLQTVFEITDTKSCDLYIGWLEVIQGQIA